MISWDTSDLRRLTQDLGKVPGKAVPAVTQVTNKGALNIKQDWAKRWQGHPHIPALPAAINYDMRIGLGSIEAEIGPDKSRRQGPLGNIIEFGTPKNAPIPGGAPALAEETPKYEQALMEGLTKLLEG